MAELTREDILEEFLTVLNICQPDHPHYDDPYPITKDEVEHTWKRKDSSKWAACGPRSGTLKVKFAADKSYFNRRTAERRLCIYVHEATHVFYVGGYNQPGHPPKFWREMAFHALVVRDHIEEIEEVMGEINVDNFLAEVCEDPNASMVDRRQESVEERREEMRDLVGLQTAE